MALELKDKISEGIRSGNLSLSSRDVSPNAAAEEAEAVVSKSDEPTTAVVPDLASVDPVVNQGAGNDAAAALKADPAAVDVLRPDSTVLQTVTVTAEEKASFKHAFLTNTAWRTTFSLFGGEASGRIRSRTNEETYAILTQLEHEIRDKRIQSSGQYNTRLRIMVLAAQIESYNSIEFQPLKKPHLCTVEVVKTGAALEQKIIEPAWLEQTEYWNSLPDHVLAVLYGEVSLFERKYWVLIEGAKDTNF